MRVALRLHKGLGSGLALTVAGPLSAWACAVCYGDPGAPASRGLAWAVGALVLLVGLVLSGVVAFFVQAVRREQRAARGHSGAANLEVER